MNPHKDIQDDWKDRAEGHVLSEIDIIKPDGRPGKIDIYVEVEDEYSAVIEIKEADWDAMTPTALKRNVKKIIEQIWSYIEAELARGHDVTPGVIFTNQPKSIRIRDLIEAQFDSWGIAIVWQDETIEERKSRE